MYDIVVTCHDTLLIWKCDQIIPRPLNLEEMKQLMIVNDKRFQDEHIRQEWRDLYEKHLARQHNQCEVCKDLRKTEMESGARQKHLGEDRKIKNRERSEASRKLKQHLASGDCKDYVESDEPWFFDLMTAKAFDVNEV